MKIEHIAIWVDNIETIRHFYETYFDMISNDKYINQKKRYMSYFLSFKDQSCRLELMCRPDIENNQYIRGMLKVLAHIAISVGSKQNVDILTERLRSDGFTIESEPRITGDGYYESIILDPEGNFIEITV